MEKRRNRAGQPDKNGLSGPNSNTKDAIGLHVDIIKADAAGLPKKPMPIELVQCFWGSFWDNPSIDIIGSQPKNPIEGLLSNSMFSDIGQHIAGSEGKLIYIEINDSSEPVNGVSNKDVLDMICDRLQHTGMPAPIPGHARFYLVILPPGIEANMKTGSVQDQCFMYNHVQGYYACLDYATMLKDPKMGDIFSKELMQACYDGVAVSGAVGEEKNGLQSSAQCVGKISQVMYDRYGDFNGFIMKIGSKDCFFKSYGKKTAELILRACRQRLQVLLWFDVRADDYKIRKILIG